MTKQISRAKLKSSQENVFEIEQPDSYTCIVERYEAGHPTIWLSLYKTIPIDRTVERTILKFTGVSFYAGPMQWIGANFRIGSMEEWLELMHSLGWIQATPPDAMSYLSEELRLFIAENSNSNYKVRIVAANVHKADHIPNTADYN